MCYVLLHTPIAEQLHRLNAIRPDQRGPAVQSQEKDQFTLHALDEALLRGMCLCAVSCDGLHMNVCVAGDDVILNKPVEEWPRCDILIAFFSDGV